MCQRMHVHKDNISHVPDSDSRCLLITVWEEKTQNNILANGKICEKTHSGRQRKMILDNYLSWHGKLSADELIRDVGDLKVARNMIAQDQWTKHLMMCGLSICFWGDHFIIC